MNETNISPKQQAKEKDARVSRSHEQPGRASGIEEAAGEGPEATDSQYPGQATRVAGGRAPQTRLQRFPRTFRLRKHREFLAVQRRGRRQTAPYFVVITRTKEESPSRLGITTSRKVGTAPERNRVRRLVREFFRRQGPLTPPCDIVVIARPGASGLTYHEVADQLSLALLRERSHPR
jgi:ribonuclease P protein component